MKMIFMALDLLQYISRRGKYGQRQQDAGMQIAFSDRVPDEIIEQMNSGDMIFTQRLDSLLSWAMMYFTSSSIDHMAIYIGDGKVIHMTLSGERVHSLRAVAKGARVLIVRMGLEATEWIRITQCERARTDKGNAFIYLFPPRAQLIIGATQILTGKYPDRINYRIIFDSMLFLGGFYVVTFWASGLHLGGAPMLLYVGLFVRNLIVNRVRRYRGISSQIMSHPDVAYRAFYKSGGLVLSKIGPVVVCGLGLIPLKVAFCFAENSSGNKSENDPDDASKFFDDLIKGWKLHSRTK